MVNILMGGGGGVYYCTLFPGQLEEVLSKCRCKISVKFHFTDLAPCRPSRAAGPSKLTN